MTFHSIVRQWCRTYRPMLDSPKNRRFYLTDSWKGAVEMAKGITPTYSPCVVMESAVEGGGPFARPSRNYPVYFFVRARKMSDGDAAAEANEEAWIHAQNFLSWLKKRHDEEIGANNIDGDYARIDIDNTFLDIETVGPLEDGWHAVMVQLGREEPLDLCPDEGLYIEED